MTDHTSGGRPETRVEAMRVALVIGANRLEILAGPSDVVLDVVRMWLEAIGGTDTALITEVEKATEVIDATNKKLTDAQTDDGGSTAPAQ